MIRSLVLGLLLLAPAFAAVEDDVKQAEKDFSAALTKGDFAAMDRLLASELSYTHSTGKVDTKTSYLASLKSGTQKYQAVDYEDIQAKVYGNTALIFAVAQIKSETAGKPSGSHLRFLRVYVKKNGHWQMVAHESTKLPS
jgi:ketosteroid isomerase-like protein